MGIEMVRDIYIMYDNKDDINNIKTIIENNYNLFISIMGKSRVLSLVPTDEEDFTYIEDFDKFFYDVTKKLYDNNKIKKEYGNVDILVILYIETLIRKDSGNDNLLIAPNNGLTDETLYAMIAYKYFMENASFDDFVEYLKYRKDTDKILEWLRDKVRFDAYNYLLGVIINNLKNYNFDFLENISEVVNIMLNQVLTDISNPDNETVDKLPLTTQDKINELFLEFLQYINAPDDWKKLYEKLKENNLIIFEEQTGEFEYSKSFIDEDEILKICICTDGTIKSFCSLVHEFIHYISMNVDDLNIEQISILEFPSIFFEKLSLQFLRNKGYSNGVINKITEQRIDNNSEIYTNLASLFYDISRYINHGPITKEDRVNFWSKQYEILENTKKKLIDMYLENGNELSEEDMDFLESTDIDLESAVLEECDILTISFLQNGLLVIDGYQYLLDTFLAEEVLKKANDNKLYIEDMIYVTEELNDLGLYEILDIFDIKDLFDKGSDNIKKRKL